MVTGCMNFSERFNKQASTYAAFRPEYPDTLFQFLQKNAPTNDLAWDCATGIRPHYISIRLRLRYLPRVDFNFMNWPPSMRFQF